MVEYYVYPDGSAYSCEEWSLEDLIQTGHSDDCAVMELPDDVDCADTYFYNLVMEVNLGTSTERKTIL